MYIRIAFRHLWHNKLYASINVIGLAVGICAVLLAVLYWKDERSFDRFHQNGPDLYRVTTSMTESKGGPRQLTGGTGQVQGPAFKTQVPEVLDYTRVLGGGIGEDVHGGGKSLRISTYFVDDNFLRVFSFPLTQGNPQTVLTDINSAVITESAAKKFFSTTDVIGKQLELDADPSAKRLGKPLRITGVVKDCPVNSSFQFDLLLPMKFAQLSFADDNWLDAYLSTFVLLHPGADQNAVTRKFARVYQAYAHDQLAGVIKAYAFDPQINYGLQPLTDLHLHPLGNGAESGIANGSSPVFSWLFMGIACFILLMASINFINISLADALKRSKEVGIRKITGGSRVQIIGHFVFESGLLCLLAFVLAGLLVSVCLPVFNELAGKHITLRDSFDVQLLLDLLTVLVTIVLFTGIYPAYVLSGFNATEVLSKKQKTSGRNWLGRGLVVVQFSLTVFLLIATLVYTFQMNYIRTKDLGYNPHQVIQTQISGARDHPAIHRFLRARLANEPSISVISFGGGENNYPVRLTDRTIQAIHKAIDEDFLRALQIPLTAGRNFSASYPADSSHSVLVNEAFVKAAGLESPIGTPLKIDETFDKEQKTIVGVIKDYHSGSLREPIKPMVLFMNSSYGENMFVRLEKSRLPAGLAAVEKAYKEVMPSAVYQFQFLDDLNARQYVQEQRWRQIISIAAALSIAICCLGLFGLAHLAANQRVKEIGIRKVLGATVTQVVTLLSMSFLKLVGLAIIIATPIAWLVMDRWLQDFAYRIEMGFGIVAISTVICICTALLAVSFQAIKAARGNPVESLRSE